MGCNISAPIVTHGHCTRSDFDLNCVLVPHDRTFSFVSSVRCPVVTGARLCVGHGHGDAWETKLLTASTGVGGCPVTEMLGSVSP